MVSKQKWSTYPSVKPGSVDEPRDPRSDKCVIKESGEIKKLVRQIIKQNGLKLEAVCRESELDYPRVKAWLNARTKWKIAQNEIIDLCEVLGINVRITLVVSKKEFPDDMKYAQRRAVKFPKNSVYDTFRDETEENG